ncbi:hypothetical protein C0431_12615 [bacterium]|nr:hypothetical protein [bacterium]
MKTIKREALMPWILSSIVEMGGVVPSELEFELELKDRGPDENKLGADLKFTGPEVVTEFFVAAALYLSEDKGEAFLDAIEKMGNYRENVDLEHLRKNDVSMELSVDFTDINNPIVKSNNLSAEGFLVMYMYFVAELGEETAEEISNIILRITERLMNIQKSINFDDSEEEALK